MAPPRPPSFVQRSRLDDLLTRSVEQPLTLISAHAGTGKTALLASWASGRRDVAWLTVDRDDNWSPHFWQGVELALDRVLGTPAGGVETVDDPVRRIVERLPPRRRIVLVLDDLHEIENPVVLKELGSLISHSPNQLRVVVATRADPPLRIQRQRIAGQLAEVRASDLAFTAEESRDLLGPLAELLDDEDVATLCDRTEGWAAGLRLAALSLEGEDDKSAFMHRFAGDDRAVSDYLLNEIFDRLPEVRRRFVLRTAVPKQLTPDLAVELSGDPNAARVLNELETANFFISSQAGLGAYRYHALLREFLLARFAQVHPKELRSLQCRTARWAWRHGDPETAFRHAIAGEDWDLADELTAQAWDVVVFGVAARDRDAVSETPEAQLDGRPALALRVAAAHLFLGNRLEAERIFRVAEGALESATPYRRRELAVLSKTFVLTIARLEGDYDRVLELARELELEPIVGNFAAAAREKARQAIVLSNLGTVDVASGSVAEAEPQLYEAMSLAREVGLDHVVLNSLSQLAMLESTRGRLRHAVELAREAVDFAERRNWELLHQGIGSRLVLGWAYYQWNELELASEHITQAAAAARLWGDRTGTVGAALLDALVLTAAGPNGSVDGLRRLRGVRAEIHGWRPPVFLAALVQTAEARVLAASGDLEAARLAIERSEPQDGDGGGLVLARISLAQGSPSSALAELEAFDPSSGTHDLAAQVEAGVLQAVAKHELNDRAGAGIAIEAALGLAERGSYRRPFVDGGPSVRGLLVERVRHGTDHRALVAELIAALERRAASTELTLPELLEPLSDREQAVLRYLPTMMSNAEIASELFLSVNTVKTHLKAIYRKLGATRRRDAVERARRVELL